MTRLNSRGRRTHWEEAPVRFAARTSVVAGPLPTPCWQWNVVHKLTGYGSIFVAGKGVLAHRWSYEYHVGPIPDGLQLDHLCRNRGCVNPEHLEPVTSAENSRRGAWQARNHCVNGHEYTPKNLLRRKTGARSCRECARVRYRAKRAAVLAGDPA